MRGHARARSLRERDSWRRALVSADHLHVDRRGQAEVQDLADDVGRLEEESAVRETRWASSSAQLADVVPGGAVLAGLQRDEDLAVEGADGDVVAEGQIEPL